jgi:hypothetical protein
VSASYTRTTLKDPAQKIVRNISGNLAKKRTSMVLLSSPTALHEIRG